MNIFYLHKDPKQCAELHTDGHVPKMIVEYTQMLCTVTGNKAMKPTHTH